MTRAFAAILAFALLSAVHRMAIGHFDFQTRSLLPASRLALGLTGVKSPATFAVVGAGRIEGGYYVVPANANPGLSTLVAAAAGALAVRTVRIVAPPRGPVIAVAAYDDGLVFHDPRTFAQRGTLATGGPPSDVAPMSDGFVTTDTDGDALTRVSLAPWGASRIEGVPLGDELVADPELHAIFVTERGVGAEGGLARVGARGTKYVVTGVAEGIALDARRQRVYVADTDRGDVAVVDARTMRVITRIDGIPRAFSLALSPNGERLFAVSNQGRRSFFNAPGSVSEIALYPRPRILKRSAALDLPVGIALDSGAERLFVTDEQSNVVDVLDARTLRKRRAPLRTCSIPWQPLVEKRAHRLFVPCAGSNEVDVFDTRTLSRVRGAPFHTGGYPLALAISR